MDLLRTLWRAWRVAAKKIGEFQSWVILTILYFVVIAPFALAIRWFSDPLQLQGTAAWYGLPRDVRAAPDLNAARRQF